MTTTYVYDRAELERRIPCRDAYPDDFQEPLPDAEQWLREDHRASATEHRQEHQRAIAPSVHTHIMANADSLSHRLGIPKDKLSGVLAFWVARVPDTERHDWAQGLSMILLESRPNNAALAFAIARARTIDWWRRYKLRQHYHLDFESEEGDVSERFDRDMREYLTGVDQYQQIEGKVDAESLWSKLPPKVQAVVTKRLVGTRLTGAERVALHRWLKVNAEAIAEYA